MATHESFAEALEKIGNPLGEVALTLRGVQVENSWTKGALQQLNRDALEAKCDELERAEGAFEEGITQLIDVDGEVEKQAKDLEKSLNNSIAKQYREELEVLATAMANPTIMRDFGEIFGFSAGSEVINPMIVAFAQQFHATADNFMAEKLQAAEDELAARDPDDLDIFTRAYLKQKALQNGNDDISISDDFMNRLIKIVVEQLKDMVGIDEADKMSNSIYARYLAKKN